MQPSLLKGALCEAHTQCMLEGMSGCWRHRYSDIYDQVCTCVRPLLTCSLTTPSMFQRIYLPIQSTVFRSDKSAFTYLCRCTSIHLALYAYVQASRGYTVQPNAERKTSSYSRF